MVSYTIRRLLAAVLVTLGVCFLTFTAIHLAPGDVAESIARGNFVFDETPPQDVVDATAARYQLTNPFFIRFLSWLSPIFRGDFGISYAYNIPVAEIIFPKLRNTIGLGSLALLFAVLAGVPLGAAAGFRQGKAIDTVPGSFSLILVSVPSFCLGLGLIILFSVTLGVLPVSGKENPRSFILPSATLALGMFPAIFQITRGSIIDLKNHDFIKMVKAKGLPPGLMVGRHLLKNAAIPLITVIASQAGHILGGSVVVETVFGWPGIGKLVIDSIKSKDIPALQCCVLIIALGYALVNIAADFSYAIIDPRIRAGRI
ncbi:MAG: ABC transporter permease [Treponema sp.]|jgi:peptide/nickel transport system permease protein|nr:ABC transporter permease [Treponema sp.]